LPFKFLRHFCCRMYHLATKCGTKKWTAKITSQCQMVPACMEWWCEMENRATTSFGYCSSTASLPVWLHCTNDRWIRCQADLNSFPLGELETTGMPLYYADEDYAAAPGIIEPLPEWSNWRGSELSTLEIDVYVWRYTLIVVHARNEWMN